MARRPVAVTACLLGVLLCVNAGSLLIANGADSGVGIATGPCEVGGNNCSEPNGECVGGQCRCLWDYSWSSNCTELRVDLLNHDAYDLYRAIVLSVYFALAVSSLALITFSTVTGSCTLVPSHQAATYAFLLLAFTCTRFLFALAWVRKFNSCAQPTSSTTASIRATFCTRCPTGRTAS